MSQTFCQAERLKSRKAIAALFQKGHRLYEPPLRLQWRVVSGESTSSFPVQIAFSVPKRHFARATDRNRLKRQMREAYRLQKAAFYDRLPDGCHLQMMLVYTGSFSSYQRANPAQLQIALTHLLEVVIHSDRLRS